MGALRSTLPACALPCCVGLKPARVLRVAESKYVPPKVGDPYPLHPISILAAEIKKHMSKPSGREDTDLIGCQDLMCRPFYVDHDRDALGRLLCPTCGHPCTTERRLRAHVQFSHGIKNEPRATTTGKLQCKCGAVLAQRNSFNKHRRLGRCGREQWKPGTWKRPGELKARR